MKYTIRIKHLFLLIPITFVILVFTTGWEYGFLGSCDDRTLKAWQGMVRLWFTFIGGFVMLVWLGIMADEGPPEFLIRIFNKKLFDFNLSTSNNNEDWEEFLEWKKKHALNKDENF